MAYTVKKLSELSGVTVRTLHFYEEIGILKPAYHGANRYRYYEEKELLQLQQILFFKELGFSLNQIQKVVGRGDFDQLAALYSHRRTLSQEWEKIGRLLKTIDHTIQHLEGKKKMKDKELFDGFNIGLVNKAKKEASYFAAEALVVKSVKQPTQSAQDVKARGKAYYDDITQTAHTLFKELVHCLQEGLDPSSDQVQEIVKRHYLLTQRVHNTTPEVYKALAQLYREHPDFRKQLDPFHPDLASFLSEAMVEFADHHVS